MSSLTRYEYICHPLLLAVAGGLNLPSVLFGIVGFTNTCAHYSSWLIGNGSLACLHILASIYCVYKVRQGAKPSPLTNESESDPEDDGQNVEGIEIYQDETERETEDQDYKTSASNQSAGTGCFSRLIHLRTPSSDRIRHLICYDALITTYAIMFIFWVFWLSEGVQRLRKADSEDFEDDFEGCETLHERYVKAALISGFLYVIFVAVAGLSSLC